MLRAYWAIVAVGAAAAFAGAGEAKKEAPKARQMALRDVNLPLPRGKENELAGVRLSGQVSVDLIEPVKEEAGRFQMWVSWGRGVGIRGGGNCQANCCIRLEEKQALRYREGDTLQIAGDVEKVVVKRGIYICVNPIAPPPKKPRDEMVNFYLTNVTIGR